MYWKGQHFAWKVVGSLYYGVLARILALNASYFLKGGGHFVISIKANCIDSTVPAEAVFESEVKKMVQEQLKPSEQVTLEPFERDHACVVGGYQKYESFSLRRRLTVDARGGGWGCKKNEHSSVLNTPRVQKSEIQNNNKIVEDKEVKKQVVEEGSFVRKEIFVIKHRKSQDRDKRTPPPPSATASASEILLGNSSTNVGAHNMVVRTSSCKKEEVDAILIQCGRLSRSNSSGSGKPPSSGIKYSGSKRSYDFDNNNNNNNDQNKDVESATYADHYDFTKKGNDDDDGEVTAERRQHRSRRQSSRPSPSPSSQGRRRTPSREKDQNQLSGSRERGSGCSGRRVSRSPGRRSETTQNTGVTARNANATVNANHASDPSNRPGKMSNNGVEPQATTRIKRISVKRNVGEAALTGTRTAASPRSKSPARTNAKTSNENNQRPSLSRNNSRKADQTPYRRNPLSEIDPNSLKYLGFGRHCICNLP
ncbi:hypothetical protein SADUNF_Sadunf16G0310300 [Salix dunnii]|uniref:Uncharacterized protein n=1 Tax=Salix dunnii TaxID=1413687 RepID=A0A835MIL0_9ROSI|nr:hypothetical protein SADUNF_Sadunf16G0310300 [Salix dunnii]